VTVRAAKVHTDIEERRSGATFALDYMNRPAKEIDDFAAFCRDLRDRTQLDLHVDSPSFLPSSRSGSARLAFQ
jgi:hypothetical protein